MVVVLMMKKCDFIAEKPVGRYALVRPRRLQHKATNDFFQLLGLTTERAVDGSSQFRDDQGFAFTVFSYSVVPPFFCHSHNTT